MKHTPAPWHLIECSNGGMLLVRPAAKDQHHHIQSHLQILPTADAVLMHAAPEMLEALQEALAEAIDRNEDIDANCWPLVRAAIEKATKEVR